MTDAQKVLAVALGEVGYLEKETAENLDSRTENAGDENYTMYARDLDGLDFYNSDKNGHAWCDVFVDWCFVQAFGEHRALKMTFQPGWNVLNRGAGCRYSCRYYQLRGRLFDSPQPGDQIFFYAADGETVCHTGLVYAADESYVYTVEGNTDSAPGVEANGGSVRKKQYLLSDERIAGYGRPDYEK